MGNFHGLNGTPWHIEKMVREDDDSRRHRTRCFYYRKESEGYCCFFCGKCRGAAHCDQYKEDSVTQCKTIISKKYEPFEGIKFIELSAIYVPDKFIKSIPEETKMNEIIQFMKEQGRIDKPIVVSCENNQYKLEDRYLRYFIAKRLGLKELPAEMGTKDEVMIWNKLRTIGSLVWVKKTSDVGEVVDYDLEKVKIRMDSGNEIIYDIHKGIKSGSIKIL